MSRFVGRLAPLVVRFLHAPALLRRPRGPARPCRGTLRPRRPTHLAAFPPTAYLPPVSRSRPCGRLPIRPVCIHGPEPAPARGPLPGSPPRRARGGVCQRHIARRFRRELFQLARSEPLPGGNRSSPFSCA